MSNTVNRVEPKVFDPMKPANIQEPFVYLAKLREQKPVYWSEQYSFWMLTRYQDVKAVLRAR